jgi:hypothetical protein
MNAGLAYRYSKSTPYHSQSLCILTFPTMTVFASDLEQARKGSKHYGMGECMALISTRLTTALPSVVEWTDQTQNCLPKASQGINFVAA